MKRISTVRRRDFLRSSAAGVAVVMSVPSWGRGQSPNEKLNLAAVGAGGRNGANIQETAGENFVAFCDVDDKILAKAIERFPGAKPFNDYRIMLDEMDAQIDAVVVGTPDHIHAPAGVTAMRMGKHCYCEKPLSHSVYEARTAAQVAAENKLATQMGTQIHAGPNYRRVVELIQSEAIGPVGEVHVWCGKGWGGGELPTEEMPVPEHLDWDLWLGPAPFRPYHSCYAPKQWRRWWDFGNGTLGDMACHYMDLPFWALDLRHPTQVEADGPPVHPETCPTELKVSYQFPGRHGRPPVRLTWYDGGYRPPILDEAVEGISDESQRKWGSGVLFIGSKGMLLANYTRNLLLPEKEFADFEPPEPTIPDSIGHQLEWVEACKTGSPTTCNFDYSGALAEAVLLGSVAYRTGETLHWNAAKLKATGCDAADRLIRREYRKGWTL